MTGGCRMWGRSICSSVLASCKGSTIETITWAKFLSRPKLSYHFLTLRRKCSVVTKRFNQFECRSTNKAKSVVGNIVTSQIMEKRLAILKLQKKGKHLALSISTLEQCSAECVKKEVALLLEWFHIDAVSERSRWRPPLLSSRPHLNELFFCLWTMVWHTTDNLVIGNNPAIRLNNLARYKKNSFAMSSVVFFFCYEDVWTYASAPLPPERWVLKPL